MANIISNFLNKKIIDSKYLQIDFWHIIHLLSGYVIIKILYYNQIESPFLWLFFILIIWELFEILTISLGYNFFEIESPVNILFDIIIGMIGGLIAKNV